LTRHQRFPRSPLTAARRDNNPGDGKTRRRVLSIQQALEWAFGKEKAQLEPPQYLHPEQGSDIGIGLEYIMIQRGVLGCEIDGGQHKLDSYTHEDAEVIAAIVAGMPHALGGWRMAIRVAELARAGLTPNWMPGALPRCVPVETRRNRYGDRAVSEAVGIERVLIRRKWRSVEVRACPVTFRPDIRQIESARKDYEDWWAALDWLRDGLIKCRMLREVEVSEVMPKVRPWEKR